MTTLYCSVELIVLIFKLVDRYCLTEGMVRSIACTVMDTGILIPGYEKMPILDTL
jgi:hypothetical protein